MHIPDGLISAPLCIANLMVAATAVAASAWHIRRYGLGQRSGAFAPLAAAIFAAQMLNYPVGLGTSGHVIGAASAVFLLGPAASILMMSLVLVVQALCFADGGLLALGSNIVNLGVVAAGTAWACGRLLSGRLPAPLVHAAAAWVSVLAAATTCSVMLVASGAPASAFADMLLSHARIGVGEAAFTALLVLVTTRCGLPALMRPVTARN
jgi:cobalt/nickel transport system permease protein